MCRWPRNDAGQGLDLDILERGALDLGEIADLRLREFDVVDGLRRQPWRRGRGFRRRDRRKLGGDHLSNFSDKLAYRRVAASGDIGDDAFDRAADFGVGLVLLAGQRGGLDVPGHRVLLVSPVFIRSLSGGSPSNLDRALGHRPMIGHDFGDLASERPNLPYAAVEAPAIEWPGSAPRRTSDEPILEGVVYGSLRADHAARDALVYSTASVSRRCRRRSGAIPLFNSGLSIAHGLVLLSSCTTRGMRTRMADIYVQRELVVSRDGTEAIRCRGGYSLSRSAACRSGGP